MGCGSVRGVGRMIPGAGVTGPAVGGPRGRADRAGGWTPSPDGAAVTAASDRIDRLLAADPLNAGESRDGDDRILFDQPLGVIFRVDRAARVVFVLTVGL